MIETRRLKNVIFIQTILSFVLSRKTFNTKSKNILVNTSYRQPAGRYNEFEIYVKQFLCKSKNKKSYLVGNFNLNLLDHRTNTKVKR